MEKKLAQYSTLGQKDKGPAFISLIPQILVQPAESLVKDLHTLVDTVVNQDSVGLVVGRQVLSELVKVLAEGVIKDLDLRKLVVEDTLNTVQPRIVSYEEQVGSCQDCFSPFINPNSGQHLEISTCRPTRRRRGMECRCKSAHGHLDGIGSTVCVCFQY
jgi:hypothetical protein